MVAPEVARPPLRSLTPFNLNMQINNLNDDGTCYENEVNWCLKGCLELNDLNGFRSAIGLCGHELPHKSAEFKAMHANLWTCSRTSCEGMLERLYEEGRCQTYHLLTSLAREILPANKDNVKLFLPRLERLRTHCPDADAKTIAEIIAQVPQTRVGALRMLQGWETHLKVLMPSWPYSNFFKNHRPSNTLHMASLAVNANLKCERFVVPSLPSWGQTIAPAFRMFLDSNAACMARMTGVSRTLDLLHASPRILELGLPSGSSHGRYRRIASGLEVITKGDVGVWIGRLVEHEDQLMKTLEPVCDSLWGDADCNKANYPLPTTSNTSLVIIMGLRPTFRNKSALLDVLKPVLMSSDVEGFQSDIHSWFKLFACDAEGERPAFLTSTFVYY